MRPKVGHIFALKRDQLGEMVCSHSLRSDDDERTQWACFIGKWRAANGLIMATAEKHRLPRVGLAGWTVILLRIGGQMR